MAGRLRRLISRAVWPAARPHTGARRVVAHEWFTTMGGSDKVAARLVDIVEADVVYAFAVDARLVERLGVDAPVVTWRFGHAVARFGSFHLLLPLMPLVWRALDLAAAELVVTSSHSCVNAVAAPGATRISYVHTPMRYAWNWRLERERVGPPLRWMVPLAAPLFQRLDRWWSRPVDVFVANSQFVSNRIRRAYGRDAVVVPPPIDTRYLSLPSLTEGRSDGAPERGREPADRTGAPFVLAGRFVAYKQARVAVEAANVAGVPLIVAGSGPELAALLNIAGPNVTFVHEPSDAQLRDVLRGGRALVFPGVDDFGMLPVEAQACGLPVIARSDGGACETVVPGVTGVLVDGDDPTEWAKALIDFDPTDYDTASIRANAERFGVDRFDAAITAVLADAAAAPGARRPDRPPVRRPGHADRRPGHQ